MYWTESIILYPESYLGGETPPFYYFMRNFRVTGARSAGASEAM